MTEDELQAPAPTKDDRRKAVMVDQRKVRRDMAIIAALCCALIGIGTGLAFDESDEIKDATADADVKIVTAAIANCDDLTDVQDILTDRIRKNSRETRQQTTFDAESLGITQDEFDKLLRKELRSNRHDINRLTPTDTCDERFADF